MSNIEKIHELLTKFVFLYFELIQGFFYSLDGFLEEDNFAWFRLMVQQHSVNVLTRLFEQNHEAIRQMDKALERFSISIFGQMDYLPYLAVDLNQG